MTPETPKVAISRTAETTKQHDLRHADLLLCGGTVLTPNGAERIDIANSGALGKVILASQKLDNPEFPGATVRTPVLLACDAGDEKAYMEERFGPISFIVKVADTTAAVALSERVVSTHGALTVGLYSTKQDVIDAMTEATWRSKVALSINLTGAIFVNQSAAFSDYHGTGGNPAANASYSDSAFVANRFRVVQRRETAAGRGGAADHMDDDVHAADREQHIGGLGVAIAGPRIIGAGGEMHVVEIDRREVMPAARQIDDALSFPRLDQREQLARQREVAEVVGADLHFEPVGSVQERRGHHARIVDQDVDLREPLARARCGGADAFERAEIERDRLELRLGMFGMDRGDRFIQLALIAPRHDHLGPARRHRAGALRADLLGHRKFQAGQGDGGGARSA